jgi:hypothetical protein
LTASLLSSPPLPVDSDNRVHEPGSEEYQHITDLLDGYTAPTVELLRQLEKEKDL